MTWSEFAVLEYFDAAGDTVPLLKRITCKLCGQVVFNLADGYDRSSLLGEGAGLRVHYAIHHEIFIPVDYHA